MADAPVLGSPTNPDVSVTGVPPVPTTPTDSSAPVKMVPMIAPDGSKGGIPSNRVNDAVRAGGKVAVNFVAPDGTKGLIPLDKVHDAIQAGGHIDDAVINALSDNSGFTGVASGIAKSAAGSMSGALDLVGGQGAAGKMGMPSVPALSGIAEKIGAGAETVLEFMLGDEALKGLSLGQKLEKIAPTVKALEAHPALAKVVSGALKGGVIGGAEGAVKGAPTGDAVSGAAKGAGIGVAAGAVSEAIPAAVNAVKNLRVNPFREIAAGKSIAQAPAEAAVRGGVQESANVAGTASTVAPGIAANPILENAQTVLDEPLQALKTKEAAAYKQVDDFVKFDLKDAKLQLKNDQYNLSQLGNTPADQAARERLTASISDTTNRINSAERNLKAAGIDPKAADAIHTSRMAGEDFKKTIVRNTSPDGTINVDKLLKDSKTLRFNKRGDRLGQFMGKQGADTYMDQLEAAQKAGVHAMKVQRIAKWIGGIAAAGIGLGAAKEVVPTLLEP